MTSQTPHSTRTTVSHSILTKLLHACMSVVAAILAGGVVLFGFCALPFSPCLRLPRGWTVPPCLPNHKEISFMAGFNKVILLGHLTRNRRRGDDMKEEVCFIDIVVFGTQAEHCAQYLTKGNGVIVDGRLLQRRWETEDGHKRSKHEVMAQTVRFLPKGGHATDQVERPSHEPDGAPV